MKRMFKFFVLQLKFKINKKHLQTRDKILRLKCTAQVNYENDGCFGGRITQNIYGMSKISLLILDRNPLKCDQKNV